MHRDLCGNPKTGKTTGEQISSLLLVDVQYKILQQPLRALRVCCYTHIYGGTHATLSRALTHSFYCSTLFIINTRTKVCPSYIYTYVTFRLFTFVALIGLTLRLFTNIVLRVGYTHVSGFGRGRQSTRLLSSDSSTVGFSEQSVLPPTGGTYSQ